MKKATATGKRVADAVREMEQQDWESAFLHLSPAIDATAKRMTSSGAVGARIRAFLHTHHEVLFFCMLGIRIKKAPSPDGNSRAPFSWTDDGDLWDVLYKFGRCAICHEGEMPRLVIDPECGGIVRRDDGTYVFRPGLLWGFILAVISEPKNSGQRLAAINGVPFGIELTIGPRKVRLSDTSWGKPNQMRKQLWGTA